MLSWLQKIFMSKSDDDDGEDREVEESPFLHSQHLRIVIAMAVVFISGLIMWWILE